MDIMSFARIVFGNKSKEHRKINREIKVRCPSISGDISITMSIEELKKEFKDYLIIDPTVGEKVDLEKLANLEIDEVVVISPVQGG